MTQAYNLSQLANNVDTNGKLSLTTGVDGTLPISKGGTNSTDTPTDGGIAYGDGAAIKVTAAGTLGQVLTSQGTGIPIWSASIAGQLLNIQYFTASGTYTATAGTGFVVVEVQGGGAAGAGAINNVGGRGGGAGGYSRKTIDSNFSPITVTVGGAGGTSSFGSFLSATGGSAITGGSGSGGDLNMQCSNGGQSVVASSATIAYLGGFGGGGGPYACGGANGAAVGAGRRSRSYAIPHCYRFSLG